MGAGSKEQGAMVPRFNGYKGAHSLIQGVILIIQALKE